jgi:hypothetical protein
MDTIKIRTRHHGDNTIAQIGSYQRTPGGPIEKYMKEGWYEFYRANNIKIGDKVQFQLSDPPYIVILDIVRKPITD